MNSPYHRRSYQLTQNDSQDASAEQRYFSFTQAGLVVACPIIASHRRSMMGGHVVWCHHPTLPKREAIVTSSAWMQLLAFVQVYFTLSLI